MFAFKLSVFGGDSDHNAEPLLLWLPFDCAVPFDCDTPNWVAFVSDFNGLAGSR